MREGWRELYNGGERDSLRERERESEELFEKVREREGGGEGIP